MALRKLFVATIANGVTETEAALAALPVELCSVPVSKLEPCTDEKELARVAARIDEFDWTLLTSANAAALFFARLGIPPEAFAPRIACIGPATAACVRNLGYAVAFTAAEHTGDAFAHEFAAAYGGQPLSIVLPRPEKMASALPALLGAAGIAVTQLVLYRTVPLPAAAMELSFAPEDLFAFLSPSGVRNFTKWYSAPKDAIVFAIGPATAAAAADAGFARVRVAPESSRFGLLDEIQAFLEREQAL